MPATLLLRSQIMVKAQNAGEKNWKYAAPRHFSPCTFRKNLATSAQLSVALRSFIVPLSRPLRSALYIPGSKPRALDKARSLKTDAIIFDLEDAVSIEEKDASRKILADELDKGGYGQRYKIVPARSSAPSAAAAPRPRAPTSTWSCARAPAAWTLRSTWRS
jgi:hypothetical protein